MVDSGHENKHFLNLHKKLAESTQKTGLMTWGTEQA
jgi:hypothetical protein